MNGSTAVRRITTPKKQGNHDMIAIGCENISLSFGGDTVLDGVGFSLGEGGRLGIVGVNGAGKTSLLRIITGEYTPDSGSVYIARDHTLGVLSQYPTLDPERTVYEEVLSVFSALTADEERLEELRAQTEAGDTEAADRYAAALRRFDDGGGRTYRSRCRSLLLRFGFDDSMMQVRCAALSGGQKTRLALVRLLLEEPDIMLLDEPTNHLDTATMFWLEEYLTSRKKTVITVSHDRYFLDRVCSVILELDGKSLYAYRGNYEYYLEKREERIAATNANIARANNLYRKELDWMRRMPCARGTKARYRKEAFVELEQQAKRRTEERAARLEVKSGYIGSKIFEAEYVSKSFPLEDGGEKVILKDFYYNFSRYEKMGIVGGNGAGKSTFIKMLLGEVKPDEGRFVIGETVRFGYFSQDGMAFDQQMKVIDAVRRIAETIDLGGGRKLTAMQFLTHFLFPPARQQDYIYKLSGGERRRLYLCTVLMQNPNFLILDEPTNDLDIPTLQILEEYLADFKGCVIVVSHDRYFMDRVVDHLLVFKGEGKVDDFPGNYTQYRDWSELKEKEEEEAKKANTPKTETKANTWRGEQKKRLTFKERQEMAALEVSIEALEKEKKEIEEALCSGTLSVDELTEKSKRLPLLQDELDEKSMRWLELSEIEG